MIPIFQILFKDTNTSVSDAGNINIDKMLIGYNYYDHVDLA